MKKELLLIISILLIFITIFLSINLKQTYEGKILKIDETEKRTVILLENYEQGFILFDKINLENCSFVKMEGKTEIYKSKKQVLVDKIICSK